MSETIKHYVYTKTRHYRYVFFIDSKSDPDLLLNMMHANLRIWGGRYNPIVPVYDDVIDERYLNLIKDLDPDYVFYTKGIDIDKIKGLNLFNPVTYTIIGEHNNNVNLGGMSVLNLINEDALDYIFYNQQISVLQVRGLYNIPLKAVNFYQINYGLTELYHQEDKLIRGYDIVEVTKETCDKLNELIYNKKVLFNSILAQQYIDTLIHEPSEYSLNQDYEIIVYDPKNTFDDLLYYWNRQLYLQPSKKLEQIIISKEDLETLSPDSYFAAMITYIAGSRAKLVSKSVSKEDLEGLILKIKPHFKLTWLSADTLPSFPYKILRSSPQREARIEQTQILQGKADLLVLHKPNFNGKHPVKDSYCLDVRIVRMGDRERNAVKFPFKSSDIYNRRINKKHNITLFCDGKSESIHFDLPSDDDIIRSLLNYVYINGESKSTGINHARLSNHGKKLSAFLKLFDHNWDAVRYFIDDKFWVDLFRSVTETPKSYKSAIPNGKGVFSYKDLVKEREALYDMLSKKLTTVRREVDNTHVLKEYIKSNSNEGLINYKEKKEEDYRKRYFQREIEDDLLYYIKPGLQSLVDIDGLFIGMKVKCETCGANSWYPLSDLKNKMTCKGCHNTIIPTIESSLYYKLNEIIVNNMASHEKPNSKSYDGNYYVLQTLLHYRPKTKFELASQSNDISFIYSPCIDYIRYEGKNEIQSDIDILFISHGEFIIGEAKANASKFDADVIKELIWLGNNIHPDKLILAYGEGKIDNALAKVKAGITTNCEVISYKIPQSSYMQGELLYFP